VVLQVDLHLVLLDLAANLILTLLGNDRKRVVDLFSAFESCATQKQFQKFVE
jgi:hypothetical protein